MYVLGTCILNCIYVCLLDFYKAMTFWSEDPKDSLGSVHVNLAFMLEW